MRLRVKDYCRIILYLPSEDKFKAQYRPEKPKRIEDDVEMHISEDETPVEPEDASTQTSQQRPPSYNPEDYAHAIAKYARASNLYIQDHKDKKQNRSKDKEKNSKDVISEMSLKQFASLPELLRRLREDLKTAYLSFVKELVREPHDGTALLMDLLKMIQLAQSNLSVNPTNREQQIALRRALIDEFECLSCLRCCLRCSDAAPRLANYRNGLYALAAATMSSLTRSRTLALQLLTKACDSSTSGHRQVVEAFSTLRLRFAEPVRCKFLVSMMLSYPHPSFQLWGLKLINSLLNTSACLRERIYLQEELGEAGFDIAAIKKGLEHRGVATQQQEEAVKTEIDKWSEGYIDLSALEEQLTSLKTDSLSLRQELQHLRQANMKLLEENVLLKAVGGEVEERCTALKRRLESHGIPSAPSPVPSMTDSEVSSFVTTGRSTVKRNGSVSPNRTISTICGPDSERSTSLEWKLMRSSPDGQGPSRQLSRQGSRESGGNVPPIPKKRHIMTNSGPPPELPKRSVYINDFCAENQRERNKHSRMSENRTKIPAKSTEQTNIVAIIQSDASTEKNEQERNRKSYAKTPENPDTVMYENMLNSNRQTSEGTSEEEQSSRSSATSTPIKTKIKNSNFSAKASTGSEAGSEAKSAGNKVAKKCINSNSSLSSSTSSLSSPSSGTSLDGGDRKEPQYENVQKKERERERAKVRESEEGELDYERDVIVYEAITMGTDTILLDKDKTSTNGSKSSSSNSADEGNKPFSEGPNVRLSVRHYENLVSNKKETSPSGDQKREIKSDGSKGLVNGFINGLKMNKKKSGKADVSEKKESKKEKKKKESSPKNSTTKTTDVSDKDVEAVMNSLESILQIAESSMSLGSLKRVKENPLLKENFEDRASPEQSNSELEIVQSRAPAIPPRARSRGASSHSSKSSRTPDPVIYLESPSETSDTDTILSPRKVSPSPLTMDSASTRSFGWVRGDPHLKRRDTFADRMEEPKFSRRPGLRRSESVHASNISEYNSHRSYSPIRRGSSEFIPLEEKEVQINGRTYTKYAAADVRHRNHVNNILSSDAKRRRNRSYDDRLDQWLEEDCIRQKLYENERDEMDVPSRLKQRHSEGDKRNFRAKNNDNRNISAKHVKNGKSRLSPSDLMAFSGFQNPKAGMRESDYGSNFILNSPTHHRLEEVLSDLADFGSPNHGKSRRLSRKLLLDEDPAIPTPDYSATPAGTLTNNETSAGRHILDMVSGLY